MTAVKEKIIDAVMVMDDTDAELFWEMIEEKFTPSWNTIEEVMPDEIDIQMLEAIKNDPECHEFTKEQDIIWD